MNIDYSPGNAYLKPLSGDFFALVHDFLVRDDSNHISTSRIPSAMTFLIFESLTKGSPSERTISALIIPVRRSRQSGVA